MEQFNSCYLDYPDSTSSFTCSSNVVLAGNSIFCSISAKKSSAIIYAYNSSFSLSSSPTSSNAFFSFLSPFITSIPSYASSSSIALAASQSILSNSYYAVSTNFYGLFYTLSGHSALYTLSDGVSATTATLTVCTIPDSSTVLTSSSYSLAINGAATLTITPKLGSSSIYAFASNFSGTSTFVSFYFASSCVGCTANTFSSLSPSTYGNSFTLTLNVGNESGNYSISLGYGNSISVLVYDTADSTSSFSCTATTLAVGATMTCTLLPKVSSRRIYTNGASYSLNSNGMFI